MLGDLRPHRGKVNHLTPLIAHGGLCFKRPATYATAVWCMDHDHIRTLAEWQCRTFVTLLSAGLLVGGFSGVHDLPADAVAGRRLTTVVAVGVALLFKRLNTSLERFDDVLQIIDERKEGLGTSAIE